MATTTVPDLNTRTDILGRGVILNVDQAVPAPWDELLAYDAFTTADTPREFLISETLLNDLGRVGNSVDLLHQAWVTRKPVIIRLAVTPKTLRQPGRFDGAVWEATDNFDFPLERLRFLVRSNNYDARRGTPIWWAARNAIDLGATEHHGPDGDVVLPDGTIAWVDGGPRGLHDVNFTPVLHRETISDGQLTPDRPSTPTFPLAPDQHAAVTHLSGPARIIAPAGSGKTRVLTQRIETLVGRGWNPDSILALAYNTRAAKEMRERLPANAADVRTIHSFALDLLSQHAAANNYRKPRVLSERDTRQILARLVDVKHASNHDPYAPWLDALGSCRLGLNDPNDIEETYEDVPDFADVYARYREVLDQTNSVDFDEMIYGACHLMLTDPTFREQVQGQYRHVLLDEAQDIFPATMLLVRLVAAPELDVFVVGDPQQSVYGFNGARPEYVTKMERWFPGFADHPLEVNYRCPTEVVDAMNRLLGPTSVGLPAPIRSAPDRKPDPKAVTIALSDPDEVAVTAADQVKEWLTDGIDPQEIAVLCRVNAGLLPVQVLLAEEGIRFEQALDETILNRTGIRAALAYLDLAAGGPKAPMKGSALFDVANRPSRRMTRKARDLCKSKDDWTRDELVKATMKHSHGGDVSAVIAMCDDIDGLRRKRLIPKTTTARLLDHVGSVIGLDDAVKSLDGKKRAGDKSGHGDDIDALRAAAALHPKPAGFEDWLRGVLRTPTDPNGVRLSTIHRTKGLEWDHVVILNASVGKMPHDGTSDLSEERRVFHVAATRCRERLCITGSKDHPSPFIAASGFTVASDE